MDFLYRGASPTYKGCTPQAAPRSGLLAGMWRALTGGSQPAYRQAGRVTAGGETGVSSQPATEYRAAPAPETTSDAVCVCGVAKPVDDASEMERECEVSDGVPTEIHIW